MRKFRNPSSRNQLSLLPASIEEYVGAEDMVRYVDELVELLDLSGFDAKYSFNGRPAFEPRIIVKILVFGSLRGIRSARELSRECRESLRFIFLAQNEKPDFRTINLFRKEHSKELASLLRQTIEIGIKEEMIDLKAVAVDGTKIRAFAGHRSFGTASNLRAELDRLEKDFEKQFIEDSSDEDDNDDDQDVLPLQHRDKERRKERLKAALEEYNRLEREIPRQISTTDPESRFMKGPEGSRPSYNVQAAVDAKSRMVVGGYATCTTCDHGQLSKVIDSIKEQAKQVPDLILADKGYSAIDGLVALKENSITGFISQRVDVHQGFKFHPTSNTYICPNGRSLIRIRQTAQRVIYQSQNCGGCSLKTNCLRPKAKVRTLAISNHKNLIDEMRLRCSSELGDYYRRLRACVVEPLFGHLKYARKLQRFVHRGIEKVNCVWQFELAAYNIEKLARYRTKTV